MSSRRNRGSVSLTLAAIVFLGGNDALAKNIYQCVSADGEKSYQDTPCEEGSESTLVGNVGGGGVRPEDKKKIIERLGRSLGKEFDPNDPKTMQAVEALLVTDAAKAYAFTKVYGVSLDHCPDDAELKAAMKRYESAAEDRIALGEIYYREGIDLEVGDKRFQHSGPELTAALEEMLEGLRTEHHSASPEALRSKCQESAEALGSLAHLYGL